jgi:hypothetical protein
MCGGVNLPLRSSYSSEGASAGRPMPQPASQDQACPRCETYRRRLEPAGDEPAVWYDTLLRDWVVRLPVGRASDVALLPLEFRWFDAPWAAVYRAAGDLVYGGDALEDIARLQWPRGGREERPRLSRDAEPSPRAGREAQPPPSLGREELSPPAGGEDHPGAGRQREVGDSP